MERRVLAEESPLRVLLLAELGSIHSYRWAKALAANGVEVAIFSRSWGGEERYRQAGIRVYSAGIVPGGLVSKVRYVLSVRKVRQAIRDFKPHILHAHYAATYGILGVFAGKHPYVVSVWGGDVYDFPLKGWLHRWVIKRVFRKADRLLSTSNVMAKRAAAYTDKSFTITPFGVDLQTFIENRKGGGRLRSYRDGEGPHAEVRYRRATTSLCAVRGEESCTGTPSTDSGRRARTKGTRAACRDLGDSRASAIPRVRGEWRAAYALLPIPGGGVPFGASIREFWSSGSGGCSMRLPGGGLRCRWVHRDGGRWRNGTNSANAQCGEDSPSDTALHRPSRRAQANGTEWTETSRIPLQLG